MFDEARLERLIAAYFDQELDGGEKRELEEMLLGSSRAREIFLEQSEWHGLLREQALQSRTALLMDGEEEQQPLPAAGKVIPFRRPAWLAAGLAACVAFGLWMLPRDGSIPARVEQPKAAEQEHVAMLAQAIDVTWREGAERFGVGSALPKGWLKIAKGTLRLDFYSGARVILEGPAAIELLSPDLARLETGKLTARVPPPAEGFTVMNANLRVVDRGTEFGMNASGSGTCEVHVFDGEVELQGDVPAAADKALYGGDAVSIHQGKWMAFPADRNTFVDPASMLKAAARETEARWESWRSSAESFRANPGLKVYFDFESLEAGEAVIRNQAQGADTDSNGTVIGCDPLPGRWARKGALGFAKTSDRVRFRAEGSTPSLTMMAWVRVDSLPQDHNSLLCMAPDQVGEVHWKLDKSGRLLVGLRAAAQLSYDAWERLESPRIVTEQDFGRWMHLATVIDGGQGMMRHFVNGVEVASAAIKRTTPVQLGMANLGNFDAALSSRTDSDVIRSFNGRIDEFALFTRALSAEEIAAMN